MATEDAEDTEQLFLHCSHVETAVSATLLLASAKSAQELGGRVRACTSRVRDEPDRLTEQIIGCAIEVHRHLGAGLLESAYETALCIELSKSSLRFDRQKAVPLYYGEQLVGAYRPDLIVENEVVVEVKSVLKFEPVFVAQMLTYLRITGLKRGLILNFNRSILKAGIKRVSL